MENKTLTTYPKLTRIKHNDYYSGLVQNLFCGKEGKVASFLQFTYQANILAPFGSSFARLFSTIASDELYHIKLLSETVISLGGDPVYALPQGLWFSGRWIDYVKDIKQMVFLNIENKEKSIIDYKTTISKIDDPAIKQMLTLILKEEIEICKKLKQAHLNAL